MIEVTDLTKRYRRVIAVDHMSLTVPAGAIYGLIGRNGAGKTTTMRIISTLLHPTSGRVRVGGHDVMVEPGKVRRLLGYMPDFFGVYDDLKVWEYLDFYAATEGVPARRRPGMVSDLLELVDLAPKREEYVDSLSRGMKQRLCLAHTLVHDPQVLILDEPASGLDPRARIEMRELLKELRTMGKTIVISSHILSELADLCTHIGIVEGGKMVVSGTLDEVLYGRTRGRLVRLRLAPGEQTPEDLAARLDHEPLVRGAAVLGSVVEATVDADDVALADLLGRLVREGFPVASFSEMTNTLEEIFLQATAGQEQPAEGRESA